MFHSEPRGAILSDRGARRGWESAVRYRGGGGRAGARKSARGERWNERGDRDRSRGAGRTSAPRVAKSAERMEGETMTEFLSHASTLAFAETENAAEDLTAVRLEATLAPARALRAKTAELAEMADMIVSDVRCVEGSGRDAHPNRLDTPPKLAAEALARQRRTPGGCSGESASSVPVGGFDGLLTRRSRRPETRSVRTRSGVAKKRLARSNGFSDQRSVDRPGRRSSGADHARVTTDRPRSGRTRTPTFLAARNGADGH